MILILFWAMKTHDIDFSEKVISEFRKHIKGLKGYDPKAPIDIRVGYGVCRMGGGLIASDWECDLVSARIKQDHNVLVVWKLSEDLIKGEDAPENVLKSFIAWKNNELEKVGTEFAVLKL